MNQIYKITNQINGKLYVGLTTQGMRRRWCEHISRFKLGERDHKLYQAMRKYGLHNFKIELICETNSLEKLIDLEVQYIKKYDSFNNGYNMTCGGDVVSEETKQKLSKIFSGRKITWYDKILKTRSERRNLGFYKDPKDFVPRGADNVNAKKYLVKHPDGRKEIICGLNEFCKKFSLDIGTFLGILKGRQHQHKGFVLLSRLNDHPFGEYSQVAGNGECPVSQQGSDMVLSVQ